MLHHQAVERENESPRQMSVMASGMNAVIASTVSSRLNNKENIKVPYDWPSVRRILVWDT